MKENITLISMNAQLKETIMEIENLQVFSDMDIFKEDGAYLFMYQIYIGESEKHIKMNVSMIYQYVVAVELDEVGIRNCLYQIHPYLLEIMQCLLKQCIEDNS